jgi:hypothetical protein
MIVNFEEQQSSEKFEDQETLAILILVSDGKNIWKDKQVKGG